MAVEVAIGVIINSNNEILLTKRNSSQTLSGTWVFPGGKREADESFVAALARELKEEVGIVINNAIPVIEYIYHYHAYDVLLKAFRVTDFSGEAAPLEQQELGWFKLQNFNKLNIPVGNKPIVTALKLPATYWITPSDINDVDSMVAMISSKIKNDFKLIQLRLPQFNMEKIANIITAIKSLSQDRQTQIMLNSNYETAIKLAVDGVHLNSENLQNFVGKNAEKLLVAASCHNAAQLQLAVIKNVDFATLSPVNATLSHPEAQPLGWQQFKALIQDVGLPVYALGGMQLADLSTAINSGAQGIAAIRG